MNSQEEGGRVGGRALESEGCPKDRMFDCFGRRNFLILWEKSIFFFTDEPNIDVLMEIEAISLVAGNIHQ